MRVPENHYFPDNSYIRYWLGKDGKVYCCLVSKSGRMGRKMVFQGKVK